ncbi:MAG: hypothetical protein Q8N38_07870 [Bacteroidales bacterium]|nr:hypothetical protein [Bacteroidales bacterium]
MSQFSHIQFNNIVILAFNKVFPQVRHGIGKKEQQKAPNEEVNDQAGGRSPGFTGNIASQEDKKRKIEQAE